MLSKAGQESCNLASSSPKTLSLMRNLARFIAIMRILMRYRIDALILSVQVIQRRYNGKVDFFRGWKEYEDGFGSTLTNFIT
jgi:hypothetical protein